MQSIRNWRNVPTRTDQPLQNGAPVISLATEAQPAANAGGFLGFRGDECGVDIQIAMGAFNGLTAMQSLFVDKYIELRFNGTRAAEAAGYSGGENAWAAAASRLLRNVKINEAINRKLSVHAMGVNEVLWRLGEQGRTNPDDFFEVLPNGQAVVRLDKAQEGGKLHQIKKIKFLPKGGIELEFYDAQRALELIGKAHGLFRGQQYNLDIDMSKLTVGQLERIANGDDPAAVMADSG